MEPSMNEMESLHAKHETGRRLFTPLNILIILAVLAIAGAGTFYFLNLTAAESGKSSISDTRDKIIQYADSSSQKAGSNSGSSSSKSSNSNSKPNSKSLPASKGVISSNPGLTGSSDGGAEDPDGDDEDGDKRKKKTQGGSSTDVTSTEEESDSEEGESEEGVPNEGIYWVDQKLDSNGAPPLVGNPRP
jgi:hypothetical protein